MDAGWTKLKRMVAGGTPNIAESTLKNLLSKGKKATVVQHKYLEGWKSMPKDIAAVILVVRGPIKLDNVELLIDEMQRNILEDGIDYVWTHIPDKTASANAIVIHGNVAPVQFDWDSGIVSMSKKFMVELVKKHTGWKPGMYHKEPEIKKVKVI
jgi:hypothetical protein